MMNEYDPTEPSLGQAFANILRGVQNPQQWQQTGQGIVNTAQAIPSVVESLGRGGVAQAVGTMGDLRDLLQYCPKLFAAKRTKLVKCRRIFDQSICKSIGSNRSYYRANIRNSATHDT
jgi:hypothetical protein